MYDNGLLSYYKKTYFKDGFLDVKKLKIREDLNQSMLDSCVSCKSPVGVFYKKYHHYFSKEMADAEILLSQVYNKLGLTSAVYIPAQENGRNFLLSNSIQTEDVYHAPYYHEYVASSAGCSQREVCDFMNNDVFESQKGKQIVEYFSQRAIAQKVKMRALDCASNNPDRADCNFMYKVDDKKVAQDIVVFDHERSGLEVSQKLRLHGFGKFTNGYGNDFGLDKATRQEVIDEIKQNPIVESVVDTHELAQEIGSVNIHDIALDICRTTGYVIEPSYTDFIAKSFHETATQLDK